MALFMFIISILLFLVAAIGTLSASTVVHSINASIYGAISAIFFIGAAIVEAIASHTKTVAQLQPKQPYQPPAAGIKTKSCHYCDAEINATAAVCPKCGKVL